MSSFLPPVLFEIKANATQAIATFEKVNAELTRMEAKAVKAGTAITGVGNAAKYSIAFLKGMSVAIAAFGAVGVFEFMQLEKAMIQLGQAMSNAGVNTAENRKEIEKLIVASEGLAFDADQITPAYTKLITATQNVTRANELLGLSMDLARIKSMPLEQAAVSLARASAGNARAFKEFGISLDTTKPKAVAIEEAMAKLEQRIGGQAEAYLKTFAGQLELLQVKIQGLAEAFGSVLIPMLNKFLTAMENVFSYIGKNKALLASIAVLISTVVTVAVVNLTKKLWLQAAAWAAANWQIALGVAAIMLLAAGFVKAWNASEQFRIGIEYFAKGVAYTFSGLIEVTGLLWQGISLIARGMANLVIVWGKFTNNKEQEASGKKILDFLDGVSKKLYDADQKVIKIGESFTGLRDKKINIDLSLPSLASLIPDFGNGVPDLGGELGIVNDALVSATQSIADFNRALESSFTSIKNTWTGVVGKDFKSAIEEGLLNPVDKLIVQAQKSVDVYQSASNSYKRSLIELTNAQNAYASAVSSGNKTAITSTGSALKFAEEAVNQFTENMQKSIDEIAKFQEDAINAVIDSYNKISELETKRTEVLAKAKEDRYELEKDYNKEVAKLNADYNKNVLNAQKEAALRSAEIVKQSIDQLRGVYKTATYQSLGDIFSNLTFQGRYLAGGTTEKILSALGLKADKAKTLAQDAATLAGLGFSQTFIEEVVAQGTDVGHQLAQTIITSTPESIKQMQAYWDALQKQSSHGVDSVASKLNAGVVLATEELTAQLAQVGINLNEQLAQYNVELTGALASSFDTYANSLAKINSATAAQIISIDAEIGSLKAKILQLNQAQAQLQGLSSPGTYQAPVILAPSTETEADKAVAESQKALAEALAAAAEAEKASLDIEKYLAELDKTISGLGLREQTPTVTIYTDTNASPQLIADEVAWAIRTSGDMKYGLNQKNRWML
jgi:hypothetical protein